MEECRANIERVKGGTKEKQEKVDFWRACIILCEGLIAYAHRMADEAERQASECTDEKRKQELLTIAQNCRVVPENPPQTFWQALQMIWFIQVAFHIEAPTTACGFGRFDQYMYPSFKADKEKGTIDDESALELLECFYLKCCEVYEVRDQWYAKSFAGYPMWEILVVGGQTPDGKDASNELSYMCLDAAADLQTTQPVLALRVFEGTPESLIRKGAEMVQKGMANPDFSTITRPSRWLWAKAVRWKRRETGPSSAVSSRDREVAARTVRRTPAMSTARRRWSWCFTTASIRGQENVSALRQAIREISKRLTSSWKR